MTVTIVNDPEAQAFPVTIQVSLTATGELQITANGVVVPGAEMLFIKHKRPTTSAPVVVPVTLIAPSEGWQIAAEHTLDTRALCAWATSGAGNQCSHTWAEVEHEYGVSITAHPPSAGGTPLKKTVYLKVRPEPDLPG